MLNIKTIADDADIIVNGYAFNKKWSDYSQEGFYEYK
jgi:hypothetical protein